MKHPRIISPNQENSAPQGWRSQWAVIYQEETGLITRNKWLQLLQASRHSAPSCVSCFSSKWGLNTLSNIWGTDACAPVLLRLSSSGPNVLG